LRIAVQKYTYCVAVSDCVMVACEVFWVVERSAYMIHQCVCDNVVILRERFEREAFPRDLFLSHEEADSVREGRDVSGVVRRSGSRDVAQGRSERVAVTKPCQMRSREARMD
jgi:hypothetical protein